jgi:hypothetical protein
VSENALYGLSLGDDGEDAKPTAALGTRQHVHVETAAEEIAPIHLGVAA